LKLERRSQRCPGGYYSCLLLLSGPAANRDASTFSHHRLPGEPATPATVDDHVRGILRALAASCHSFNIRDCLLPPRTTPFFHAALNCNHVLLAHSSLSAASQIAPTNQHTLALRCQILAHTPRDILSFRRIQRALPIIPREPRRTGERSDHERRQKQS